MDAHRECKYSEQMTLLMSLSLDGMLDRDGAHRLSCHLASCPSCQLEWDVMQRVSLLFEDAPMVGPPLGFAIRLERRLEVRERQRRRTFGGVAVLTSSLSLAWLTVSIAVLLFVGVLAWNWFGSMPSFQTGTSAVSQLASGVALLGRGASFFLSDLLLRYGPPLVLLVGIGLAFLSGLWAWLFVKRPGRSRGNGLV